MTLVCNGIAALSHSSITRLCSQSVAVLIHGHGLNYHGKLPPYI